MLVNDVFSTILINYHLIFYIYKTTGKTFSVKFCLHKLLKLFESGKLYQQIQRLDILTKLKKKKFKLCAMFLYFIFYTFRNFMGCCFVEPIGNSCDRLVLLYCCHVPVIRLYDLCISHNILHHSANNYSNGNKEKNTDTKNVLRLYIDLNE